MLAVVYDIFYQLRQWCLMTNITGSEFEVNDPNDMLTPRQREVLLWVAEGKENSAIGAIMGITTGTVKFHMICLLEKFNAPNRQLIISRAFAKGMVSARHLVLAMLIAANCVPSTGNDPITLRTPRVARIRVGGRRSSDNSVLSPTNLGALLIEDKEAA